MKRLRLDKWASIAQAPRNPRLLASRGVHPHQQPSARRCLHQPVSCPHRVRSQWTGWRGGETARRQTSTVATAGAEDSTAGENSPPLRMSSEQQPIHTPSLGRIAQSAKLSALHARLALPSKLPLKTLARCLIDPSANPRPGFNNAPLAVLGSDLLGNYTAEYLLCKYPRLPMSIVFAAQYAYVGSATLSAMRAEWGVEIVAAPGKEVDPGLLQFKRIWPSKSIMNPIESSNNETVGSYGKQSGVRRWRRSGASTRVVHSDQFGEPLSIQTPADEQPALPVAGQTRLEEGSLSEQTTVESLSSTAAAPTPDDVDPVTLEAASAAFVRALAGALYLHAGAQVAKDFHRDHILSRHLQLHTFFNFTHPTRDLSRLCAREGFEPPVARLLSETGRLSRTPVFVVGIFSGDDKLGEGVGSSLNEARVRASTAALRSWYLYSPPISDIMMPSDVEGSKGKPWKPQMIDVGEIIT